MSSYNEKIQEFYDMQTLNAKQKSLNNEEDENKNEFLDSLRKTQQEIDDIKNKYVIKLETKPIEKFTESQLLQDAQKQVDDVYDKKFENLTQSSNEKIQKLNNNSQNAVKNAEIIKKDIENTYDKLDKKAENDAIRQGIQRSSIITEKIKSLSKSKIQELLNVDDDLAETLYQNNAQIKKLEEEYQKSVSNLQTSKAVDVKQKLDALIKEQDQRILDTMKYNQAIAEEEKRQNEGLQNLYTIEGKERVNELELQKMNLALNYYFSIPKEQALQELEDEEIKNLLGDDIRNTIIRYLNNQ